MLNLMLSTHYVLGHTLGANNPRPRFNESTEWLPPLPGSPPGLGWDPRLWTHTLHHPPPHDLNPFGGGGEEGMHICLLREL